MKSILTLIILALFVSCQLQTTSSLEAHIDVQLDSVTVSVIYDEEVFDESYNSLYINPDSIYGASNYGVGDVFAGKLTANGERYNPYDSSIINGQIVYTAANFNLPFNTIVEITNIKNGRKVLVRINDGGPYACEKGTAKAIWPLRPFVGRKFDLNYAAARQLDCLDEGVASISARIVTYPSNYVKHWCYMTDEQRRKLGWKGNNLRRSVLIINKLKLV